MNESRKKDINSQYNDNFEITSPPQYSSAKQRRLSQENTNLDNSDLETARENPGGFMKIFEIYDHSILCVLCLAYFVQGFKVFLSLAVRDLFKDYLNLQPEYTQFLNSIIILPWSFKIVYGLIADNFPILGSRRRSYLIINGLLFFVVLLLLAFNITKNEIVISGFLFIIALNSAFTDVVVDALMVTQSKKDSENGSENLQTLSWVMLAIGGVLGSLCSSYFTEYLQPSQTFASLSILGLAQAYFAYRINQGIEKLSYNDADAEQSIMVLIKINLIEIKEAMKMPQIYRTVLYFFLCGCLMPSFSDFAYYFQLNIIQFSKSTYSALQIIGFFALFLGTLMYNKYFKDVETRQNLLRAAYINIFGCIVSVIFTLRLNVKYGIDDLTLIIFTSVVTDTLSLAFSLLPCLVLFAKITPKNVEATIFATLTGISNLSSGVLSPMSGVIINKLFVGVSTENLENYWQLVVIQLFSAFVPLVLYRLIPTKKEIEEIQGKNILIETGDQIELQQLNK
eukprot:403377520